MREARFGLGKKPIMSWRQEAFSVFKSFKHDHHGRRPLELILPLARQDDVSYAEVGADLWSKITIQGASNAVNRLFDVPVRWADVPHVEAR